MTKSRNSATSTAKAATSAEPPAAINPLDTRITEAIYALNAQDRRLTMTVEKATIAVETAESALVAANQELSQAQDSLAVNKHNIENRRGAIAKLVGLSLEDFENDASAQALLEPYTLLKPKGSARSSDVTAEGERSFKRRRTTTGNYASASMIYATNSDSRMAAPARAKMTPQRMSLSAIPSRTAMVSTGKSTPPTAKPMEVYHQYATTYVPVDQGKTNWIELRCSKCGGNSTPSLGEPLKGCRGFQAHLQQQHGMSGLKQWEVPELCYHRDIEQSELDDLAKNGAKVAAKGEWWMETIVCAGKGTAKARREEKRSRMSIMSTADDEQDDAEDTALVVKPAAVKMEKLTTAKASNEITIIEVEENLDAPLSPLRP